MANHKQLAEQASYNVAQSNELITKLRIPLTLNQQKLVLLAVSMIKPTDKEFQWYSVSVADFCKLTGMRKDSFYFDFQDLVRDFLEKQAKYGEWIRDRGECFLSKWFYDITYVPGKGVIKMLFDSHLVPHLLNLARNYTSYELWCVLRMKGRYSIRLYQILKRDAYGRDSFTKEYQLEELKGELLASNYETYKDFRVRVIDPARDSINECSDISIEYVPKKVGKKVDAIEFIVNKKDLDKTLSAYEKVLIQINKEQKQIPGQISIFDRPEEDFIGDGSRTIQILDN